MGFHQFFQLCQVGALRGKSSKCCLTHLDESPPGAKVVPAFLEPTTYTNELELQLQAGCTEPHAAAQLHRIAQLGGPAISGNRNCRVSSRCFLGGLPGSACRVTPSCKSTLCLVSRCRKRHLLVKSVRCSTAGAFRSQWLHPFAMLRPADDEGEKLLDLLDSECITLRYSRPLPFEHAIQELDEILTWPQLFWETSSTST